ncbi:MAG: lipid A deacylase LpxR family protein [Alphaproteobacteria bacterium]
MRLLAVGVALAAPLPATAEDRAIWTLDVENDFFSQWSNSDRDYTNGLKLTWTSNRIEDLSKVPEWAIGLADWPSILGGPPPDNAERRVSLALGQSLFTPNDKASTTPVTNDRPYAGWLYGAFSLQTTHRVGKEPVRQDTVQLELGIVGPGALGRATQNNFHELIGADHAMGWSNQLRNEPGANLVLEQRYRMGKESLPVIGLDGDVIPYFGASLGNVSTYAGVGATLRIGEDLRRDFGPPRIRPSLPGSEIFAADDGFGWYLFAGAGAMAVAHNIFLDGNTFHDSQSVTREIMVGDFQLGYAVFWNNIRLTYTHVIRSPEFREQARPHQFGAISLSIGF